MSKMEARINIPSSPSRGFKSLLSVRNYLYISSVFCLVISATGKASQSLTTRLREDVTVLNTVFPCSVARAAI
jgi:hypothetical protein